MTSPPPLEDKTVYFVFPEGTAFGKDLVVSPTLITFSKEESIFWGGLSYLIHEAPLSNIPPAIRSYIE